MFKKRKDSDDLASLEGVVTFFGSHHALRAENVLRKNGYRSVLIPGPREISPNCGVALRFDYSKKEEVINLLSENYVHYEDVHHYPVRRGS